jgi:hypothetical protein
LEVLGSIRVRVVSVVIPDSKNIAFLVGFPRPSKAASSVTPRLQLGVHYRRWTLLGTIGARHSGLTECSRKEKSYDFISLPESREVSPQCAGPIDSPAQQLPS